MALETGVDIFRRRREFETVLAGPLRQAWLAAKDLPHLGEAGAARLLLFASPHAVVPVDQALCRLAVRLGLTPARSSARRLVRDTRRALAATLPTEITARRKAVLYLAHHAQSTCVEGEPHCVVCPLAAGCAYARAAVQSVHKSMANGPRFSHGPMNPSTHGPIGPSSAKPASS